MYSSNSSLALANLIFTGNNSSKEAGGLYIAQGSPTLVNVSFINNNAAWYGGLEAYKSSPVITNGIFDNNTAANEGGAIGAQSNSAVILNNATFYGNTAATGNAIYADLGRTLVINNSILWGNNSQVTVSSGSSSPKTTVTMNNSDIQGGCPVALPADGIITCSNPVNKDPAFVDAASGDLRLSLNSPVIDAGNNALLPVDTLDMNRNGDLSEACRSTRLGTPGGQMSPPCPKRVSGRLRWWIWAPTRPGIASTSPRPRLA